MKKYRDHRMAGLALALSGILAFGNMLPAEAESVTYGQYVSGEAASGRPEIEDEYTVITISTEEDLRRLAEECQLDSWSRDKYVKLENDIRLQESREIMIPSFGGIFDGCGHTVSGLEITAAGSCVGLFRYVQAGGTVRNLSVTGRVEPQGSRSRTGILAGVNHGRIISCSVSGTVTGAEQVGGLAGVNEASGEIRSCRSAAIVIGDHYTGGICGANKGTLNNCENSGSINTYSVDVAIDIEDITVESLSMDSLEEREGLGQVAAHTDTGGITGYSEGKIYYCSNSGTVGYQHMGYNTGGIVGRLHQGYLQNCTNSGHILGRKDVGGIAGQMEPFLEIQYLNDKLGEIDREADTFFDLLEAAQQDLDRYGGQAGDLARDISTHMRNVSAAAGNLTSAGNDLWYIYNQELTGINNDLSRLNQEWSDQAAADRDKNQKDPEDAGNGGEEDEDRPHFTVSGGDIILPDGSWDGDVNLGLQVDLESYLAALRRFGEGTSGHLGNITNATNDRSGGIKDNLETLNREMDAASSGLQQLADVLDQGADKVSADVDALIAQGRVLRRSISELRDDLFRYEGIAIEDSSDEAAGGNLDNVGADPIGENASDGNAQGGSGGSGEGPSGAEDSGSAGTASPETDPETEAYYDTSSFHQGKITLCINKGTVEADTNVGGIVGQVATEVDFDPEDDITITGAESFNIEQTVKAVVRESRNLGDVTGKKDYVGGIVGKADHGAIISCESYGGITSTGGSHVGGIAGASGYCIRSCSSMGTLSGKDYVGGIVGSGCDVFYSYSYPELEYSGEYAGSIAGMLKDDGILFGNYYVRGNVPGVDSIGYEGGATPLDYEDFCSREDVPEAFSEFTISFQVDGKELASFRCEYGGSLDRALVPEVPEKEGYYGVWPEIDYGYITKNQVLEARYERWISALASTEKDEEGRTLTLVQGEFLPENRLVLEQRAEGTELSVVSVEEGREIFGRYEGPVTVRVLCDDPENATAELWEGNGYKQVSGEVMGSYLEFVMEMPGTYRIVYPENDDSVWIAAACGGAVLLAAVMLLLVHIHKKRKRRHGSSKK